MKIVQLIFDLSSGGAERMVLNLCNEQVKKHEVILLTVVNLQGERNFYGPQLSKNVRVINLNKSRGISLGAFFEIYSILKKERPDVVHSHLNTLIYIFIPALLNKKIRFIHTLHSIASAAVGFKWQKPFNKWFYLSNRIKPVTLSEECAESFKECYGDSNIAIVKNGVPEAVKSNHFNDVINEFQTIFHNRTGLKFVHVARFAEVKNQQLLLDVFEEIIGLGYNVELLIIGSGFDHLKKQNFQKAIHFLGRKENPIDYMILSDCLVLSSLWEGMPMTVLEGFSCGKPLLTTPAGGVIDLIIPSLTGCMSVDFTRESYKSALINMIDRLQRNHFSEDNIKNHFISKYIIKIAADNYEKIYLNRPINNITIADNS